MRKLHVILWSLVASLAAAGTVELEDGSNFEGEMRRVASGWEVRQQDGKIVTMSDDDIASVTSGAASKPSAQTDTADPLGALRKSVESQTDLSIIVKRYELFIRQNEGKPYADDAKADLAMWQDRQAKGMKKVGGTWGDPAVAKEAFAKSSGELTQIVEAIKGGKLPEAAKGVEALLAQNQQNPGALYLQGIIAAKQNQFPQARKAFEDAANIAPWHGPALNNAAAMEWRQRGTVVAVGNLEKAMAALPLCPSIHDNVAEALNSSLREVKSSPITKRLAKLYESAEPQLEDLQAKKGMHRWGSTWVTSAQQDEIRQQEESDKNERDRLAADVDKAQARLEAAEERWRAQNTNVSNNVQAHGNVSAEQQKQRNDTESDAARQWRDQMAAKLKAARAAQAQFRDKAPLPPYAGKLQLMSEEFVLGRAPEPATAQPSNRGLFDP